MDADPDEGVALVRGSEVEVRTRFLSNWVRGFEVVAVQGDQVGVRRRSDGAVLPVTLRSDEVRARR